MKRVTEQAVKFDLVLTFIDCWFEGPPTRDHLCDITVDGKSVATSKPGEALRLENLSLTRSIRLACKA